MRLREQATVQETQAAEWQPPFNFPCEQFLGDGNAIIVREHVRPLHAAAGEHASHRSAWIPIG